MQADAVRRFWCLLHWTSLNVAVSWDVSYGFWEAGLKIWDTAAR